MKIGILQAGAFPDSLQDRFGDYPNMFMRLLDGHGFTFETWAVHEMQFPTGPEEADGWLITGSRHGAYEDLPFIKPLEALIRAAYTSDRPMVGICFGHQIIAQAFGGTVVKVDSGWEVGRKEYAWGDQVVALNAWHQDQVVDLPADAQVIATHPACAHAALVYGDRIWTVQPHPEFLDDTVEGLARVRGPGLIPDEQLRAARGEMGKGIDQAQIAAQMAAFLKRDLAA